MATELAIVEAPRAVETEEDRLLAAFAAGQAAAFEALYRRHASAVHGLTYRLSGRRSEAEELTQEVFVRAWQHRDGFESGAHLLSWLRRVAVNLWINELRRIHPESLAEEVDGEPRAELPDTRPGVPGLRLDLERALARMPPRLRAVLLLHDLYGLRHEEISRCLDITRGASKVQLHRARTRLKELLG